MYCYKWCSSVIIHKLVFMKAHLYDFETQSLNCNAVKDEGLSQCSNNTVIELMRECIRFKRLPSYIYHEKQRMILD